MRIQELRLSNILSFKYEDDINDAFEITFDPTLNIIIGGNGSGKSTALEAINFIFSRVLFKHYSFNMQHFNDSRLQNRKTTLMADGQAERLTPFRLQPNWQTESESQTIKARLALDDIDKSNIQNIVDNYTSLQSILSQYSNMTLPEFSTINGTEIVELTVTFSSNDDSYQVAYSPDVAEHVEFYLENYELVNEAITLHNKTGNSRIDTFSNTFSMLSAFRNYTSFTMNTSLQSDPQEQFRGIKAESSNRSNNHPGGEPSIFNLVKLRLGDHHYNLMQGKNDLGDSTRLVNELDIVKKINKKLAFLKLKFSIQSTNTRNWSYEFKFYDTKHERDLGDINNLSAGQKSIIHLIFEAYGQDDMKGGVVIIDEPEIHLHYQFQFEYLRILEELAIEQKTQYILVTHSEGFISSGTATYIKRFSLNRERHSTVCAPTLTSDQKKLIEILDNTQAARALFANKVLLVEGTDDEYFFRAVLKSHKPELRQEIAVYNSHGKDSTFSWKEFFEAFGVVVYFIKDLDATGNDFYSTTVSFKPDNPQKVASPKDTTTKISEYKAQHNDLIKRIGAEYKNKGFYLKAGAIEQYTQKDKGMRSIIRFCENIDSFLQEDSDNSKEIIKIIDTITAQDT